jgi:hypothetical protein
MYEVVSGDVIYPPSGVDTQTLALDIHLEFQVDGIFTYPVFIREMQIASKALGVDENPIDSRFGTSIYPYSVDGSEFDYRATNPISIYKQNLPYLYLSDYSAVGLVGTAVSETRGFYININPKKDTYYKISSMNFVIKYPGTAFPGTATKIFQIADNVRTLDFYLVSTNTSGSRGKVYVEESGSAYYGITFFVNGKPAAQPELNINQWNSLGMSFIDILDFSSSSIDDESEPNKIKVLDKIQINSVSYFQVSEEESSQLISTATWNDISADLWSDVVLEDDWYDVLITEAPPKIYGISPQNIFEIYTGTRRIIPDSNNTAALVFSADGYRTYLNYTPLTYTIIPA